jgi:hypothetical protein
MLLKLINEFSTVSGYKNQHTKISVLLYTNNKPSKKEFKEKYPFAITPRKQNT